MLIFCIYYLQTEGLVPYFHNNVRASTTWKKEMSLSNLKDYMLGQKNCNYKTQQKALEVFFKCVMVFYDQEPEVTQDFVKSLVTLLDHPSVLIRAKTVEILSKFVIYRTFYSSCKLMYLILQFG